MDKEIFHKQRRAIQRRATQRRSMQHRGIEPAHLLKNSCTAALIGALLLNFIIETLGRLSTEGLSGGLHFLLEEPIVFFYNALIIFATLLIASLSCRRYFVYTIIAMVWLALGITNGVILTQRMTPFTAKDLTILEDGLTLITTYLKPWMIALIVVGFVLLLLLLILLWRKAPKNRNIQRGRNLLGVIAVFALCFATTYGLIHTQHLQTFFGNLAYAYRDNGVAYAFLNTMANTGIRRPAGYDAQSVKSLLSDEALGDDGTMVPVQADVDEDYPNIIYLQLESFIDPTTVEYLYLSRDPCPNMRELAKTCSTGSLTVPACGAGTANVEFEVLTGLSVKFFGPGEFPYKGVLKKDPAESLAFDLDALGYTSHAIHNHRAVFYNRNTVFANIGFDTFTSLEYMNNVAKTPKNWAKDDVLTGCILDALNATEGHDMIYTISVQGHGKYPSTETLTDPVVRVLRAPTEELKWKWEYYVNQVYEMDQFVADLVEKLQDFDEPVVLALYGDHIPAIEVEEDDLTTNDLYSTRYVLWSNFDLPKADKDLYAYTLTAEIMSRIGMKTGTMFSYQLEHRDVDNNNEFLEGLRMLGYDTLYGKNYIYGGTSPFQATDMQMGVKEIRITDVAQIGDQYFIKGENFTPYSKVTLDGEELETVYLGAHLLSCTEEVSPEDVPRMKVSQIEKKNSEILSTTE